MWVFRCHILGKKYQRIAFGHIDLSDEIQSVINQIRLFDGPNEFQSQVLQTNKSDLLLSYQAIILFYASSSSLNGVNIIYTMTSQFNHQLIYNLTQRTTGYAKLGYQADCCLNSVINRNILTLSVTTQNGFFINFTFGGLNYFGPNQEMCNFGGMAIYDISDDASLIEVSNIVNSLFIYLFLSWVAET